MIIEARENLRSFIDDRLNNVALFLSLLSNVVAWSIFGWVAQHVPESAPLHYNIYFGINLYGPWYWLLSGPTLGLVVMILNFYVAYRLYHKQRIASYFLVFSSVLVELIIIFSGISLVFLSFL